MEIFIIDPLSRKPPRRIPPDRLYLSLILKMLPEKRIFSKKSKELY